MTATKFSIPISSHRSHYRLWWLFLCLAVMVVGFACHNAQEPQPAADADTGVYYPINNYFRQQITDVDTTPYFLYRITVVDSLRDSSVVNRATFDSAITSFILPELEDEKFRQHFTESVFEDAGTGSITLSYSPNDKDNRVQNVSVLLDREKQNVKWIFVNTLESNSDSTVLQRIGWKGGKSAFLNKSISYPGKKEQQRQLQFVWNDRPSDF